MRLRPPSRASSVATAAAAAAAARDRSGGVQPQLVIVRIGR
jgi:hypothetical protein